MARYLLKTEPDSYSFDDLERERHTAWGGVTNPLAQKHLRGIHEGDEVVIYHTGDERQAVGLGRIMRGAYPDPSDPKKRRVVVDVLVGRRFLKPVTLDEMKENPAFEGLEILRLPRLSVVPMDDAQWNEILRLSGLVARR